MHLAAEALQEADKWSTLSADIEETFKTQVQFKDFTARMHLAHLCLASSFVTKKTLVLFLHVSLK